MNYKEIEVEILGRDETKVKYTFNVDSISHYKQYIDNNNECSEVVTLLWLKGNPKQLRLSCGYDTFKKKIGCRSLDVSGLSEEEVTKLADLAKSFQKTRR